MITRKKILQHNFFQFLISLDQTLCNLVGLVLSIITYIFRCFPKTELFWADETFSSKCHRWRRDNINWPAKLIDCLLFFDKNHCEESYLSEMKRTQSPPECRNE